MKQVVLLCLVLLLGPISCKQDLRRCSEHFAGGAAPEIISPSLAASTTPLCFEAFAVMHSGISRTPLWSAERLSASSIRRAIALQRKNAFHAEPRINPFSRAEIEDYVRSGFDRGHMAPSGDMPSEQAQYESFSLVNIIPQHPKNNQILWEGIEYSVRKLAEQHDSAYVITGPIFSGSEVQRLNGRVLVPSHVFKAVFLPDLQQGAAYVAANDDSGRYEVVSIAALEKRIHINLFPKLATPIKESAMKLPAPISYKQRQRQTMRPEPSNR